MHLSAQSDFPLLIVKKWWKKKKKFLKLFFKREGLNVNSVDNKNSTPLHWAAYIGFKNKKRKFFLIIINLIYYFKLRRIFSFNFIEKRKYRNLFS